MIKSLPAMANQILNSAIAAVVPQHFFPRQILLRRNTLVIHEDFGRSQHYDLRAFKRIVVLGAGKASARMAEACEGLLGARIDSGLVITDRRPRLSLVPRSGPGGRSSPAGCRRPEGRPGDDYPA